MSDTKNKTTWSVFLRRLWSRHNERWLNQLADFENTPGLALLCLLGAATGLLAGMAILLLHGLIKGVQLPIFILPDLAYTDFSAAPFIGRALIIMGGAILLALIVEWRHKALENGIVHVIERLMYYQGNLPWRSAAIDLLTSTLAIATGQSVGREGVAVHIGAYTGSWFGQRLSLPHNSVRTLVGCGAAAGIAASFNTPLAAIIFAMEVVMLEYTIASFAPIILAATTGSIVTLNLPGVHPGFSVNIQDFHALELLLTLPLGLALGLIGGGLSRLVRLSLAHLPSVRVSLRILAAGAVTSALAFGFPQIMGLSVETVNTALAGNYGAWLALGIGTAKLTATFFAVIAALPGGIIMPLFVTGAALGNAYGAALHFYWPELVSSANIYALLGIGALLSATLQAPLFGLVIIFELSSQTQTILPGMLTVIIALIVARRIAAPSSIFHVLMSSQGLDYRNDPISRFLRQASVLKAMNRRVRLLANPAHPEHLEQILKADIDWLVIRSEQGRYQLMRPSDLQRVLLAPRDDSEDEPPTDEADQTIDLLAIPAQRVDAYVIDVRATLQEAYNRFADTEAEALVVQRTGLLAGPRAKPYGVLLPADVAARPSDMHLPGPEASPANQDPGH